MGLNGTNLNVGQKFKKTKLFLICLNILKVISYALKFILKIAPFPNYIIES